jgi:hypothetical protein
MPCKLKVVLRKLQPELDRIYDEQLKLRHSMARKLGYQTFTELGYSA